MNQEPTPKSKLIIDEDWKTQVAREKEQFRKAGGGSTSPEPAESPTPTKDSQASEHDINKLPPPPAASFSLLVSTLGTQALAAMGQLPTDEGQPPTARLDYAKHYIDMLSLLEEKTKNNLSQPESKMLAELLLQLRMAYVTLSTRK